MEGLVLDVAMGWPTNGFIREGQGRAMVEPLLQPVKESGVISSSWRNPHCLHISCI